MLSGGSGGEKAHQLEFDVVSLPAISWVRAAEGKVGSPSASCHLLVFAAGILTFSSQLRDSHGLALAIASSLQVRKDVLAVACTFFCQ